MKHQFMNKENGKTARVLVMFLDDKGLMQTDVYDTVEDLLADYGAYEAQTCEPLIKDEKIRKAVRAWAEINSIKNVLYAEKSDRSLYVLTDMSDDDFSIELVGWIPTLKDGESYTIDELCGEEEE